MTDEAIDATSRRLLLVQNKHSIRPLIDTGAVSGGSRLQPTGTINCIDDWTLLWGAFRHLLLHSPSPLSIQLCGFCGVTFATDEDVGSFDGRGRFSLCIHLVWENELEFTKTKSYLMKRVVKTNDGIRCLNVSFCIKNAPAFIETGLSCEIEIMIKTDNYVHLNNDNTTGMRTDFQNLIMIHRLMQGTLLYTQDCPCSASALVSPNQPCQGLGLVALRV
ncbi:unnamed protein product [Larinioides sclopetarius]|uniref:Uncharacterized protein n=1 Tax=Larinioides sclopetarius TaxID=280406 RepID=A0AAV2AAB3_9ARAC